MAAEEERKKAQEAERQRLKAETEAKERERQLALAAEQEKQKALAAQQAIAKAKEEEAQRLKDIEFAKLQAAEEAKRNKANSEEAREKQFAVEKADWDKIKDSKNPDDFYAYLNKYPNGLIAQQATFALEQLDKAKITAQADKSGVVQVLGEPRYRLGDKFTRVTKDDYTGREIKRWDFSIDRIENGLAYFKSTNEEIIGTLDGAAVQTASPSGVHKFDPPVLYLPGDEFKIGKTWTVSTYQTSPFGRFTRTVKIKIVAYEKIEIQAGSFWTYKFESSGYVGNTRFEETYWHLPDWGIRLKSVSKYYPSRGAASLESTELVS